MPPNASKFEPAKASLYSFQSYECYFVQKKTELGSAIFFCKSHRIGRREIASFCQVKVENISFLSRAVTEHNQSELFQRQDKRGWLAPC